VQSMEKYKGKYIFYSLGNFIFDQHFSFDTRAGVALKFWFDKDGVNKVNLYPYFMRNFVQPKFVEGEEAEGIIDKLNYPLSVN